MVNNNEIPLLKWGESRGLTQLEKKKEQKENIDILLLTNIISMWCCLEPKCESSLNAKRYSIFVIIVAIRSVIVISKFLY